MVIRSNCLADFHPLWVKLATIFDPLWLPLKGENASVLAAAVVNAAGLPFRQLAEKGRGWGQYELIFNSIS
jgi:hypothetical protein